MTSPADPPAPGRVQIVPSGRWAAVAANEIASALGEAISRQGRVSLALSGGSTPVPVYALLAEQARIDWAAVEVFFADERFVPADDPASNYRLVRETLLDRLPDATPTTHFAGAPEPATAQASLKDAAARYASLLPDPLDVVVLGIGEDGHTASLFPGDYRLRIEGALRGRVIPVSNAPKLPARRISLSPQAIRSAYWIVVLARGAAKAEAVRMALKGAWSPENCPAQIAREGVWILDDEAAGRL